MQLSNDGITVIREAISDDISLTEPSDTNAYYYRHLPAGEHRRAGPWPSDEKELFLIRLQELQGNATTPPAEWGIFSLGIPGRSGYQCKAFYDDLVRRGELASSPIRELRHFPVPIFTIPAPTPPLPLSRNSDQANIERALFAQPTDETFQNPFAHVELPSRPFIIPIPSAPVAETPDSLEAGLSALRKVERMTDAEKITIIERRHAKQTFQQIALEIHRSHTACSRFYHHWESTQQLRGAWGRPTSIQETETRGVIEETQADRRSPVRAVALHAHMSREAARQIRHQNGYNYCSCVAVPRLTAEARQKREEFAGQQVANDDGPPIIFSDESMIAQDLNRGGIWRKRGEILEEGFYEKELHPMSVMVWGAIGIGFSGPLIRCPESVNQNSYRQILEESEIFRALSERFGPRGFIWQQDNAPPHRPIRLEIGRRFQILDWPPYSPDLSPIEHMWAIIKKKLTGRRFSNPNELFASTVQAWREIPQEQIDRLCSSFKARCQVCLNHRGQSLNGHWSEVHRLHHSAATASGATSGLE
jgi:transposase